MRVAVPKPSNDSTSRMNSSLAINTLMTLSSLQQDSSRQGRAITDYLRIIL